MSERDREEDLLAMMLFTYLGDLRALLLIETQNVSALSEPERERERERWRREDSRNRNEEREREKKKSINILAIENYSCGFVY